MHTAKMPVLCNLFSYSLVRFIKAKVGKKLMGSYYLFHSISRFILTQKKNNLNNIISLRTSLHGRIIAYHFSMKQQWKK